MQNIFEVINDLLLETTEESKIRRKMMKVRSKYISEKIIKQAFDTRLIDQQTELNPRRNLQYYNKSENFITEEIHQKINNLFKVKRAADQIKEKYIGEPDWLDSNTRILCNSLDQILRTEQKDFNFAESQLNYINDLLSIRYKLNKEDLESLNEKKIESILFQKDDKLSKLGLIKNYKNIYKPIKQEPYKVEAANEFLKVAPKYENQDDLMNVLFGGVKANEKNKNVKRSVNITITDSLE